MYTIYIKILNNDDDVKINQNILAPNLPLSFMNIAFSHASLRRKMINTSV